MGQDSRAGSKFRKRSARKLNQTRSTESSNTRFHSVATIVRFGRVEFAPRVGFRATDRPEPIGCHGLYSTRAPDAWLLRNRSGQSGRPDRLHQIRIAWARVGYNPWHPNTCIRTLIPWRPSITCTLPLPLHRSTTQPLHSSRRHTLFRRLGVAGHQRGFVRQAAASGRASLLSTSGLLYSYGPWWTTGVFSKFPCGGGLARLPLQRGRVPRVAAGPLAAEPASR